MKDGARSQAWPDLPNGWEVVKLNHCVRIPTGLVAPEDDKHARLGLIAPNHIESDTGHLTDLQSAADQGASSGKFLVECGDLIYSKIRPELNKVTVAPERCLCSADMYPIQPEPELLHGQYLLYVLLSPPFVQQAVDASMRVAMPKVNRETLGAIRIPVPPLATQKSIAETLDGETSRIDKLIDRKVRLIELLEEKRTALITRAVTKGVDPDVSMKDSGVEWLGRIPEHWDVVKLKAVAGLQTGLTLGKTYSSELTELPYLRVANVQAGSIETEDLATVEVPLSIISRYSLKRGDVLMTEGGDLDKLGRGHVWDGRVEPCLHQNHIFAVRTESDRLLPEYLSWLTTSEYGRAYFTATAKQSTNLASTNSKKVLNFPVPLPNIPEQRQILSVVAENLGRLDESREKVRSAIALLQEYRSALISAAVTGKIDVRDYAA